MTFHFAFFRRQQFPRAPFTGYTIALQMLCWNEIRLKN